MNFDSVLLVNAANGIGYRRPSVKPERLPSLPGLLRIADRHEPGPNPGFSKEHALLAFMIIGDSGNIGRQSLASQSGLGQGSVRTVLKKFRKGGYVKTDPFGCRLSDSGETLYRSILRKISPLVSLGTSRLSIGRSQIAVAVRSIAMSITNGIEQRDSAIRAGATGATSYVIRRRKFAIPGGSSDCEKDFPSLTWAKLRRELKPVDSDAVIICGADIEVTAKLGALAAALTLL